MKHTIERMWVRAAKGASPAARDELELVEGAGVTGDHKFGGRRQITLLFADDWDDALADLGRSVDPSARRANVLLTGGDVASLVGKTVRLGDAVLEIHGVVDPCQLMEDTAAGLLDALVPNARGGIWGTVLTGASVRAGDALVVSG